MPYRYSLSQKGPFTSTNHSSFLYPHSIRPCAEISSGDERKGSGFYSEAKLVKHRLEAGLTPGNVQSVGPTGHLCFSEAMCHLGHQGRRP